MQKRRLGRSDLEVSVITLGLWQAGGDWPGQDEENIKAVHAAIDAGINFFDTAEGYAGGKSEEILGRALEGRRDEVLLATKVGPGHFTADQVAESCEKSLTRLQTDHIDLYQLHWPSGSWGSKVVPVEETMGAMLKLQEQGKIRAIGCSNFNAQGIEELLAQGRVDSLQPPFSLFWDAYAKNGTYDACRKHEIGIIPYSPLAQGLLSGKYGLNNKPTEGGNRKNNILFSDEIYPVAVQAVEDLKPIAAKYDRSVPQLALAWLLAQPGVTSVIAGASKASQITENARAADFEISSDDLQKIASIGATVTDKLPDDQTNMWA